MPGERFTKKANTPKRKRQWRHVEQTAKGDKVTRIKKANAAVKKSARKKRSVRRV